MGCRAIAEPIPTDAADEAEITLASLAAALRRFWCLARPYWRIRQNSTGWALALMLVGATAGYATLQLRLNLWIGDFFNAIDTRIAASLLRDLGIFIAIALGVMTAAAGQLILKMAIQIGWRRWITERLIARWLRHGHSYALRFKDGDYDNPDYRIAEDVRLVTESAVDFATGAINSLLLLSLFLGLLWELSSTLDLGIGPIHLALPGYLVFAAIAYAGAATILTHIIGRRLIEVSQSAHAREGDFRYDLVRVRDAAEGIVMLRGEADERRVLTRLFDRIVDNWRGLMRLQMRLAWVTTGFTVAAPVVPLLIAAPQYLSGKMTLGGLMQASQAFVQVHIALGIIVDNYARLSDWMAGINRIVRLDAAMAEIDCDSGESSGRKISIVQSDADALRLTNLHVDTPDGIVVIDNATTAIKPGEKVLIIGGSGSGKTTLFRAVAGVWPWGSGTIEVPRTGKLMFIPHRPYIPPGSLRLALTYPEPREHFSGLSLATALSRCGLDHLVRRLDTVARWEDAMSAGEQQRFAFARLLLHRPDYVLMDDVTSELDEMGEAEMMSLLKAELANTAVLGTARRARLSEFYDRTLTLKSSEGGTRLAIAPGTHESTARHGRTGAG